MQNFSSFFELMAALNFGYILSKDFIGKLKEKNINGIQKSQDGVEADFIGIETTFSSIKEQQPGIENLFAPKFKELKTKYERLRSINDKYTNSIFDSPNFIVHAMYSGLYCMMILIFIGFNWLDNPNDNEHYFRGLFFFNLFACLMLPIGHIFHHVENHFKKAIFMFSLNLGVLFVIEIVYKITKFNFIENNFSCDYINLICSIISLIIPSFFFIRVALTTIFYTDDKVLNSYSRIHTDFTNLLREFNTLIKNNVQKPKIGVTRKKNHP